MNGKISRDKTVSIRNTSPALISATGLGSLSPGDPESQAQDHGGYQGAGDREDVIAAAANIRKRAKECLMASVD